jgi:molybdopterin converting factor small subunit
MLAALGMPVDDANQAFVNDRTVGLQHPLADGDKVGVFAPLGGGARDVA